MVGYTIVSTDAGELMFLTDRPWVVTESFSSGTVAAGDTIEVSFSSDTDGDWELQDGPGGDVLARTSSKGGLAVAELDPEVEVARARRVLHHLAERTPEAYVALRAADADVPGA